LSHKLKAMLMGACLGTFLVVSLLVIAGAGGVTTAMAAGDEVKVITNIQDWQHPVKKVLEKHQVVLSKVELHHKTYPVFYVRFPADPRFAHNDKFFKPLYYETLQANGFWNYAFVDQSFDCRINIGWDKATRTLTENLEDLK
jgi:hypothetical protein